jgi:hypothetical protein
MRLELMTFAKMIEWLWSSIQSFGLWKFLLAIFLVVNLKTLPLVFHVSVH